MAAAGFTSPSRARMALGLMAAMLMQGAWLGLLRLERPLTSAGSTISEVRLVPLQQPPQKQQQKPPVSAVVPAPVEPPPLRGWVPQAMPVEAPDIPVVDGGAPGPAVEGAGAPPGGRAAGTAPGTSSSLRLTLPPRPASAPLAETMRDQIRNDPRSHTAPRSMEYQMADALGTLPETVQSSTSGTGSTVVRRGSRCTRVYDNRMKSMAPMDDRLKDAPSVSGAC